jgi:hypothetical protein
MPRPVYFEWEGRETEREPKGADWYWALGILAAAATIAALLFGDYLLTILIIVAATTIALHAAKHPPIHRFELTDEGLVVGSDLHRYERMRSFAILEYIEGDRPPVLSIKTESWLAPHLLIPLENVDADALYVFMLGQVDEGNHPHTIADVVAAWMGL